MKFVKAFRKRTAIIAFQLFVSIHDHKTVVAVAQCLNCAKHRVIKLFISH
jgi:hypothetical protein